MPPKRHRWFLICRVPPAVFSVSSSLWVFGTAFVGNVATRSPKAVTKKTKASAERLIGEPCILLDVVNNSPSSGTTARWWPKSCLQEITEEQYNDPVFRKFNKAIFGNSENTL